MIKHILDKLRSMFAVMAIHSVKSLLVVIGGLLMFTCSADHSEYLIGQWQAVSVEEKGQDLALDPNEIIMTFNVDGSYTYSGTLKYREAGSYKIQNNDLIIRDTLQQGSSFTNAHILLLDQDSLHLRTQGDRIIKLYRLN